VNEVTEPVKSEYGYHIILVTKAGKDITPAERTKFVETYEENQIQGFLQQAVEKEKVDNRLAKLVPQPQGPQGFGGPSPGRRPQ
jgi:parvulin-like peptidyl-prolyl isomerase